jgi:hypothetical protein
MIEIIILQINLPYKNIQIKKKYVSNNKVNIYKKIKIYKFFFYLDKLAMDNYKNYYKNHLLNN